ncbi:MAG: MFS transporter [Phycisphaerae bacterium]|nr:MFS transporter [Phycisphaerae bacterium]
MPRIGFILVLVFLLDTAAGAVLFTLFRWIADQNPPAESLHLGLIGASGSLVYFLGCRYVARLGDYLQGFRMPALGIVISLGGLVLLIVNRSVWWMYLLWPMLLGSWSLIFPSTTGWLRYGRSGKALRTTLFLFCIAWMSGITFGTFLGSRLYALDGLNMGVRHVYLACIGIYVVCLALLWVSGRKSRTKQTPIEHEQQQETDADLAKAFMRIGWLGNILLMLCGAVLFNLFNKLATDLGITPLAHGWLVVVFRLASLITAGVMIMVLFWHHRWWSFLLAQGLAVAGLALVGMTSDYWLFMVGFVLCGIMMGHNYYAGLYYSLSSVSSSDAVGQRGRAAINESFFPLGAIVGAGLGGLAGWFWVQLPYFLAAAAVVLTFIIQMNVLRKVRAAQRPAERQ